LSAVFFRRGDRGPAVAEVRARLARLGLLEGSQHVRGDESLRALMYAGDEPDSDAREPSLWETTALASAEFDDDVDAAVRQFQRNSGITVDGLVGPETFRRLEEARWRLGDRVLSYRPGQTFVGEDVLQLQRHLNRMGFDCGKEDSQFGPLTDRGLREFQRNTGGAVDGITGPITLRALGRLHRTVGAASAHVARERYGLQQLQTGIAGKSIALDFSPGSSDPGAPVGAEAAARILGSIGRLTADRLTARGAQVALTETAGGGIAEEVTRAQWCNDQDYDLVLSLQIDVADASAPPLGVYFFGRSLEVFSAAGRTCAESLCDVLASEGPTMPCTTDARTWDILRATRMPSVRVCFGGVAQDTNRRRLTDPQFHASTAAALAEGLTRFFEPPRDP